MVTFRFSVSELNVGDIFMKFYRNVYGVKIMTFAFAFFISELWPFDCVFMFMFVLYTP